MRPATSLTRTRLVFLCGLLILLTSCSLPGATSSNAPITAVSHLIPAKSDVNGLSTEELHRAQLAKVQQIMAGMTEDQKLGQLIMVQYFGNIYQDTLLPEMISQQFVGGYLYQPGDGTHGNSNFDTPTDTVSSIQAFAAQANADAKIPLLISIDEEGGWVDKTISIFGQLAAAKNMAQTGDTNAVKALGAKTASQLSSIGINADLAPVVDVQTVPDADEPLLGSRMFGSDPQTVATYAGAFIDGLQSNGTIGTLKHFPGLGSLHSYEDPHDGLPYVDRSKADLEKIDFAPYRLLIQRSHPAMIMDTDVVDTALDPRLPAELSPTVINGVLRQELGYDGVVVTDDLRMAGILQRYTLGRAAVMAITAGNDIIEQPYTPAQVAEIIAAWKQALQDGTLTMARIDQSVQRILLMKVQYRIIK